MLLIRRRHSPGPQPTRGPASVPPPPSPPRASRWAAEAGEIQARVLDHTPRRSVTFEL